MVNKHQDRIEQENKSETKAQARIDLPPEILSESETGSAQKKRVKDDEENSHHKEILVASVEVRALRRIHGDALLGQIGLSSIEIKHFRSVDLASSSNRCFFNRLRYNVVDEYTAN